MRDWFCWNVISTSIRQQQDFRKLRRQFRFQGQTLFQAFDSWSPGEALSPTNVFLNHPMYIALAACFQVVSSDRGNASEITFFSLTISSSSQSLLITNRPLSLCIVRNTILLSYVLANKDFILRWESRFVVLMPFRSISKSREIYFFSWILPPALPFEQDSTHHGLFNHQVFVSDYVLLDNGKWIT